MDSFDTRLAQRLGPDELDRSWNWLARKIDVHRASVSRWCKGEMRVADEHRRAIAEAVGLPDRELFDADGNCKPARAVAAKT